MQQVRVLFICMGNICRSPTAEAVFRHYVATAGMQDMIFCDSPGTHDYHVGNAPDRRAMQAALRRGYDLSSLRARQVCLRDFEAFDYVLAMDRENLHLLQKQCRPQYAHKLMLFMDCAESSAGLEVPDPYYGGEQGFEQVLDMAEDAAQGLLCRIRDRLIS
jgi:protein-tyrosine phosphatase